MVCILNWIHTSDIFFLAVHVYFVVTRDWHIFTGVSNAMDSFPAPCCFYDESVFALCERRTDQTAQMSLLLAALLLESSD